MTSSQTPTRTVRRKATDWKGRSIVCFKKQAVTVDDFQVGDVVLMSGTDSNGKRASVRAEITEIPTVVDGQFVIGIYTFTTDTAMKLVASYAA
jgi:hypothetical protein